MCFSRRNRPTDQAITERSHQLWHKQVIEGASFEDRSELYKALIKRREFLNYNLPCSSLEERPPLVAFPQATHSGRFYRAELEKESLDLERVDRFLGKGRWFRRVSEGSTVSLGGFVYYVKGAAKGRQLEIGYEAAADDRQLVFKDEAGELVGEIEPYVVSLPYSFQPRLPLTLAEEQGVIRVCEKTMAA